MSHISKIELEVRDLGILGQVCVRLGLQLAKGQKTFRWYGKDAQCDHAIEAPKFGQRNWLPPRRCVEARGCFALAVPGRFAALNMRRRIGYDAR